MRLRGILPPLILAAAVMTIVGAVLAVRTFHEGGSGDTALAAGTQQDVFSTLGAGQSSTPTDQLPWLGATITLTPDGLTISAVIADSPAEKAGLKRGDVVKSIDGTAVSNMSDLRNTLKDKKPGDTVTLSITRSGNAQDITVTLEARPEPLPFASAIFPELNGIPRDQLFSHLLGGSFQFKDNGGNTHTATIDLGTVKSVDTNAKTISVDLNSGGSKDYTITNGVTIVPNDLSKFQSGNHVTIVSVDGSLRAISKGGRFLPGFGGKGGFSLGKRGFGEEGHGPLRGDGPGF